MIDVKCDNCGGDLQITPYQQRTHNLHFCDKDCHAKWRSENMCGERNHSFKGGDVSLICDNCGIEFMRKRSKANRGSHNFCGQPCFGEWMSEYNTGVNNPRYTDGGILINCSQCGNLARKNKWFIENRQSLFCSPECYAESITGEGSPQWRGGIADYGDGWTSVKKRAIRDRDNHVCQICGVHESELGEKLSVHHIIPHGISDSHEDDNLVSLCRACHVKAGWHFNSVDKGLIGYLRIKVGAIPTIPVTSEMTI